jgi:uncharacterized protein with HEPN domain
MTQGKRRDAQRLDDMLKAIREIQEETEGLAREEYQQNRLVQKAVSYDIMALGDAASRISQRTKRANPQISWAELARYRSDEEEGPAHAYFNFDLPGTWQFVRDLIPRLGVKLRKLRVPPEDR